MRKLILSSALAMFVAAPAFAEGNKPVDNKAPVYNVDNSTEVWNKPVNTNQQGQAQGQMQGQQQTATGGNGYGVGIGQGGAGGAGGSSTSNSTANANSNSQASSNATGGNANARGGNQSQQATGGNVGNINVSNHQRQSAGSAYSANINGCGAKGGFSAGIQTFGWGVTAANCKEDLFAQVIAAEELYHAGRPAAASYLAHTSNPARRALRDAGIVDDRSRQPRQQGASSFAQVETSRTVSYSRCDMFNGSIYFSTKRGHKREVAQEQCVASLTAQPTTQPNVTCPVGSRWDGKGCWMPGRR